ncbi:hypothetical protein [Prevotella fusca]
MTAPNPSEGGECLRKPAVLIPSTPTTAYNRSPTSPTTSHRERGSLSPLVPHHHPPHPHPQRGLGRFSIITCLRFFR